MGFLSSIRAKGVLIYVCQSKAWNKSKCSMERLSAASYGMSVEQAFALLQSLHLQAFVHSRPARMHSQYLFKHRDLVQLHLGGSEDFLV